MAYQCKECSSPFITCNEMIRHTYSPNNICEEILCSCCGSDFDCSKLLHKHIVNHENEKKSDVINNPTICDNIKLYTCMFCPKQFKCISHLNSHIRVHTGTRPFKCHICGDRFTEKGGLTRHIKTQHDPQRNICSLCDEIFVNNSNLNLHMNMQHVGAERPHTCIFCGFKTLLKEDLKRHIRVHTGIRPFTCSECGDRFKRKWDLKRHIAKHTGVKPFLCHICGKSFGRNWDLKRHLHIHERANGKKICLHPQHLK